MHLDETTYELALLRGDILYYRQGFIKVLKENEILATDSFHSELPGDKDLKDHRLQPRNFIYWKKTSNKGLFTAMLGGTITGITNKSLCCKT